jgi:hypothetical protein
MRLLAASVFQVVVRGPQQPAYLAPLPSLRPWSFCFITAPILQQPRIQLSAYSDLDSPVGSFNLGAGQKVSLNRDHLLSLKRQ